MQISRGKEASLFRLEIVKALENFLRASPRVEVASGNTRQNA